MKLYKTVSRIPTPAGRLVASGIAAMLVLAAPLAAQTPVRRDVLVAAAASLSVVAPQISRAFHASSGIDVRFNFAGSNTLARQIIEGARVDVFISADEAQMDVVEQAGHVVPGSRVDVLSNQLVLIVSERSRPRPVAPGDLAAEAVRRVAMGDPAAVPAGVYGRRWLENVRLWPTVAPKVVPLPSSPAAVAAIAEGRADVGIVYATDVVGRAGVQIGHRVSLDDAPGIVYPAAAITGGRTPSARRFIAFLQTAPAQTIFAAAGFLPVRAEP